MKYIKRYQLLNGFNIESVLLEEPYVTLVDENGNIYLSSTMATVIYGSKHGDSTYPYQIDTEEYYELDGTWEDPETHEIYFKWAKQDGEGYECWGLTRTRDFSNVNFLNPRYFDGMILSDGSSEYSNVGFKIYFGGKEEPSVTKGTIPHHNTGSLNTNNHAYVDLGLPSGALWATHNIGANTPTDYGNYYAWGETASKQDYSWGTYAYGSDYDSLTKYCPANKSDYWGGSGDPDDLKVLTLEDDVAHSEFGGDWHMPSSELLWELYSYTDNEWTDNYNESGVAGRVFRGNNQELFIPAAGYRDGSDLGAGGSGAYVWSLGLILYYPSYAYYLDFDSDGISIDNYGRYYGFSVRPVLY